MRGRSLSSHRLRAALVVAVAVAVAGCHPAERVTHDLVALYPEATVRHETALVDFGDEGARESLVSGFSADETTGGGVSFVWSDAGVSELRLFVSEPCTRILSFRCWPFSFEGAPPQTLALFLNGKAVSELELAPEPGEYHVVVPADVQLAGDNVLGLRYGYDRAPVEVIPDARDERRLGVGWDWLRVDGALAPDAPVVGGAGESAAMSVPAGARVDYFLNVFPESTLVMGPVRSEAAGVLTVAVESVSSLVERRIASPARTAEIELPPSGGLVRLSLQASSADVVLRRPVIRAVPLAEPVAAAPERRPNIILYLIDTLRADHLSCYGYSKSTPRIDALAADGTLFERTLAQSSWTKPSTASILTGLDPRAHTANQREDALPATLPTLAERLGALGYETAALVVNANVSAPFGFDRGFGTFELLLHEDGILGARGDRLIDRAIDWLRARSSEEPFFLYLHSTDPHDPYATTGFHGEGFGSVAFMESLEEGRATLGPGELTRLVDLYDEDIAFADVQFGRFVDALKAQGLYEDALIVLLSDHGEEFDDHGRWRHGKTLYREQLEVPLVIKWPQGPGKKIGVGERVGRLAQHIDVVPTILDYLGRPRPATLQGRSLWRLVSSEPLAPEPAALSYLRLDAREVESVVAGNHKLIHYRSYDRAIAPVQLFELDSDHGEATSVARERLRLTSFLSDYVRYAAPRPAAAPAPAAIDDDVERQLRALGYVR